MQTDLNAHKLHIEAGKLIFSTLMTDLGGNAAIFGPMHFLDRFAVSRCVYTQRFRRLINIFGTMSMFGSHDKTRIVISKLVCRIQIGFFPPTLIYPNVLNKHFRDDPLRLFFFYSFSWTKFSKSVKS